MGKTKIILIVIAALIGLCLVFGIIGALLGDDATPTPPVATESTDKVVTTSPEETATLPPEPTETAIPATDTPSPTNTPVPTNTPTPQPFQSQTFQGTGDDIVDLGDIPQIPILLTISHQGSRNFIIQAYDQDNNLIDLIVNTIGNYKGNRPINLYGKPVNRITIKADGEWIIKIDDINQARPLQVPGKTDGIGDDVILLQGEKPDTINLTHTGERNFIIYAHKVGESFPDLIVNEIGPYQGKNLIPPDTTIIEIQSAGSWTLDIASR